MPSFRSDNNAGLCQEALDAIISVARGHVIAYGTDEFTERAVEQFRRIFGSSTSAFFVATGTAANTLAIASLINDWGRVLCHKYSHVAIDESTAPERIAGCRVTDIATRDSKLNPEVIESYIDKGRRDVHHPRPGVITISNPTEFGQVYSPDETSALCSTAHRLGYRVHVDGARFGCAVAHVGCSPRELSVDAGVDGLTFGGAKNGLASGEAVLFFPQDDGSVAKRAAERFEYHRKSTGHLLSKHRFVTAPFLATLENDVWLKHATHSNAMATLLADALTEADIPPSFPTQSNGVFIDLPDHIHQVLADKDYTYHSAGAPDWNLARFMMSFDTNPEDVRGLAREIIAAAE